MSATTSSENMALIEEEERMISKMKNFDLTREPEKQEVNEDSSTSLEVILVSKKLLTPQLLQLLKTLHTSYYYQYNEDISKVAPTLKQLCTELKITCTQKDLVFDLTKINQKITEEYIITSEVKLVR